jgi:hypothetical protein
MNPLPEDTQLRLLSKVQDRYLKNIHHPLNLEMTLPNVWREGAFHFNKNIRNNLLLFIEHTLLFFTSVTKAENSATVNSK